MNPSRRKSVLGVAREALGLAAGCEALHVGDLAAAHRQHLEPLLTSPVLAGPVRGADDPVANLDEFRLDLGRASASFADLELENLTGLVRAASGRCALPPEVPVRDAAPLGVLREQRCERSRITVPERLGSRTKLVDHGS